LDFYHSNPELHYKGATLNSDVKKEVVSDNKQSTEIYIGANHTDRPFGEYRENLQLGLNEYVKVYPHVNSINRFNVTENYNIQHYKKGQGFKSEHCERDGGFNYTLRRCLVFMTYLNDVDDGGTKFIYQDRIVKAQKGKTLIWPADWTHTHCGQISKTQEKTIVTGWFSYIW